MMRLPWILRVVADEWDRRTQAWAQKKVEGWDTEYLPPGKLTGDGSDLNYDFPAATIIDDLGSPAPTPEQRQALLDRHLRSGIISPHTWRKETPW